MTTVLDLTRAEWLKLTRRPLTRILLTVFLGLLALQSAVYALVVLADSLGLALSNAFTPSQIEEYRRRAVFPGMIGAAFGHINGLGGVFAVILAGASMGSEYDWGTLRAQLARTPDRTSFLIAKIAALLLLLLTGIGVTLVFGLSLGAVLGAMVGGAGTPDLRALAAIPVATLRGLFILLPYLLIAVCFAIARRSLLFGVAGGLVYLAGEAAFGTLAIFSALGEPWHTLYNLSIGQNINTLTLQNSHTFGLHPEVLAAGLRPEEFPSPVHATIMVALYCAVLMAAALRFIRRDVTT